MKNIILLLLVITLYSCAGTESYRVSTKAVSIGSNINLEGGIGAASFTDDPLSLNETDYESLEQKVSLDVGFKVGSLILSAEAGNIYNDFQKQVYDPTVEGDYRIEEEFSATTKFKRVNLIKKYNLDGNGLAYYSLQVFYDAELESTFNKLPNSVNRTIEGTGRGYQLNLNFPVFYMGFGQNWREYELSDESIFKMEEFYLQIGFNLVLI
jgi:hypothetical protein